MKPCDLFLDEHAGADCADPAHRRAIAARANRDHGEPWGQIIRITDAGGPRDCLDGKPLHCGACVELQAFEYRDDDYGSYTVYLQQGAPVRYEMEWRKGDERIGVLHAEVVGHEFTTTIESYMRFRWPRR